MKKIIIYFLIILVAVWVGLKINANPGYVLIIYKQWAIESTAWFVALLLLLSFFVFHLVLSFLRGTVNLPERLEHWFGDRKFRKATKLLNKGYCELILGTYKKAEKHLLKSSKKDELNFINYVLLAQTADRENDISKHELYLSKAQGINSHYDRAVKTLRAEYFLKNQKIDDALIILNKLHEEHPNNLYILKLLTEGNLQQGNYMNLQKLLPLIKKRKIFNATDFLELERKTYLYMLQNELFTDFSQIQLIWNKMPKHLRHDPEILIVYAKHLKHWNRGNEAEEIIRKELKHNYHGKLLEYYATTESEYPAKQLALGEKWIKDHKDDPTALKAMGMLCLQNRLWGQARDYLDASLKLEPAAEVFSSLGYVYEKLGENEKALRYYRKGLQAITKSSNSQ